MSSFVEPLGPKDLHALRALLSREPSHNLYLLGLLEEFGIVPAPTRAAFAFWGRFEGKELLAAVFVGGDGGLMVPSTSDDAHHFAIGEALRGKVTLRACIGAKPCVEAYVRALGPTRPRFAKDQRLFNVSADDLGPFTNPALRPATEKDVPQLIQLAAAAVQETMDRNPLFEDPQGFEARVLQRVRGKRTYVLEESGKIIFKIDVGSRSQYGAELEGLYTLPAERRKGHATLSLGQISRHLLSSLPRLALRVDEKDPSLAGVARKVGFMPGRQVKLVVNG